MHKKKKQYWLDIQNIKNEIEIIRELIGKFPSTTDLENYGYNTLALSIQKYHGGMNNIRKIFDEPIVRKDNYWCNDENIINSARQYYGDYGVLDYTNLKLNGHNDFINAIKRRKISLTQVCKMACIPITFTEKGKFLIEENVIEEVKDIIKIYGVFPPNEILLQDNRTSILTTARRFGGLRSIFSQIGYQKPSKISALEICVKRKIDKILCNNEYIDNGRKKLLDYGINLKNSLTGQWLEVDRYYYNLKLAIEIHGKQHFIATAYEKFGDKVVERTKINDEIKAKLLQDQGVDLIVIPYSRCSDEFIRASLHKYI